MDSDLKWAIGIAVTMIVTFITVMIGAFRSVSTKIAGLHGRVDEVKDLEADIETRKRVHEADDFTDADTARDWLRNRKP